MISHKWFAVAMRRHISQMRMIANGRPMLAVMLVLCWQILSISSAAAEPPSNNAFSG